MHHLSLRHIPRDIWVHWWQQWRRRSEISNWENDFRSGGDGLAPTPVALIGPKLACAPTVPSWATRTVAASAMPMAITTVSHLRIAVIKSVNVWTRINSHLDLLIQIFDFSLLHCDGYTKVGLVIFRENFVEGVLKIFKITFEVSKVLRVVLRHINSLLGVVLFWVLLLETKWRVKEGIVTKSATHLDEHLKIQICISEVILGFNAFNFWDNNFQEI